MVHSSIDPPTLLCASLLCAALMALAAMFWLSVMPGTASLAQGATPEPAVPPAAAQSVPEPGWFAEAQTAGFVGYAAAGAGLNLTPSQSLSLLAGYVPASIAGETLWQLSLKYRWRAFDWQHVGTAHDRAVWLSPLHLGVSLIYGHSDRLWIKPPDRYPDEYYPQTALHLTANVGTALRRGPLELFAEYAALDSGLRAYAKAFGYFRDNYRYWGLEAIGSLAAGLRWYFGAEDSAAGRATP